jgi:hypothetical protein
MKKETEDSTTILNLLPVLVVLLMVGEQLLARELLVVILDQCHRAERTLAKDTHLKICACR